jgi:uncharacterized protein (DUF58 family)
VEVAASLCVQLDRTRRAVGFATNARVIGGWPAAIKPAYGRDRMASLLETMARLEQVPAGNLLQLVQSSAILSWNSTVVCFVPRLDESQAVLRAWLRRRKVPLVTVVCADDAECGDDADGMGHAVRRLDALLAPAGDEPAIARQVAP